MYNLAIDDLLDSSIIKDHFEERSALKNATSKQIQELLNHIGMRISRVKALWDMDVRSENP